MSPTRGTSTFRPRRALCGSRTDSEWERNGEGESRKLRDSREDGERKDIGRKPGEKAEWEQLEKRGTMEARKRREAREKRRRRTCTDSWRRGRREKRKGEWRSFRSVPRSRKQLKYLK